MCAGQCPTRLTPPTLLSCAQDGVEKHLAHLADVQITLGDIRCEQSFSEQGVEEYLKCLEHTEAMQPVSARRYGRGGGRMQGAQGLMYVQYVCKRGTEQGV